MLLNMMMMMIQMIQMITSVYRTAESSLLTYASLIITESDLR